MTRFLILFLTFFFHSSLCLLAQNISTWKFGIEAGINYSSSSEDTAPLKKECPILPKIGITIDYAVSEKFAMQSGLFYSQKGIKSKGDTEHIKASVKLDQHTIQIPMLALYRVELPNKFKVGVGAGAYYAYGIGGKTKANGTVGGQPVNKNLNTFDNILKKNDVGLNFKILSEYDHFVLNLSYEHGLINIGKSNVMGANLDYENRIFSTTLGYRF